jgi:hypothetical protein
MQKTLREETIAAIWRAIDASQEGVARQCAEQAEAAIKALPLGTFADEPGETRWGV